MSEVADTHAGSEDQNGGAPSAGAQEPQVPYHRFKEVIDTVRAMKEELAVKDQLLQRLAQPAQVQPQQVQEVSPEQLGIDHQTFSAFRQLLEQEMRTKVAPEVQFLKQKTAQVMNRNEELEFLVQHGKDKAALLEEIRQYRVEQYRRSGISIPLDTAYDIIQAKRFNDSKARAQASPAPAQAQAQPQAQPAVGTPAHDSFMAGAYPPADLTRSQPGQGTGAVARPSKSPSEMSVEELEAQLEKQLASGIIL